MPCWKACARLGLGIALLGPPASCAAAKASPPNVVLIVVDTLRADHLGAYGYERSVSPNIDALARESIVFERAISPAPWTNPAMQGIFTGIHPRALGFGKRAQMLPAGAPTLATVLRERGFGTYGVISHSQLDHRFAFDRGFDEWDEAEAQGHDYVSSSGVTRRARAMVRRAVEKQEPFFLFAHYFDPHYRYIVHEGHSFAEGERAARVAASVPPIEKLRKLSEQMAVTPLLRQALIDSYDSEIAFTDRYIGELLGELRKLDLYRDALVILTADHGESLAGRRNQWIGHTWSVFQEVVRVPLMVKLPGRSDGRRVPVPVSTLDIFPTILDQVEATPGKAAAHSLTRSPTEGRPVFSDTQRVLVGNAVVQGNWKLVSYEGTRGQALFNLADDPDERLDVIGERRDVADRLEGIAARWKRQADDHAERGADARVIPEVSPEDAERLRKLGYFE